MGESVTTTAEAPPDARPLARVQSECFCEACGASLYLQPVYRSGEQGPWVVRCAGCGAISAANANIAGRAPWRRRLNMGLLLLWLAVLLGGIVGMFFADWAIVMETWWDAQYSYRNRLGDAEVLEEAREMLVAAALVPLAWGVLLASSVFHWRKLWHVLAAVLLPAGALALAMGLHWDRYGSPAQWPWEHRASLPVAFLTAGLEVLGGVVGVWIGRPVARGLIRVLLPPRARAALAFLWHRDGKTPPRAP